MIFKMRPESQEQARQVKSTPCREAACTKILIEEERFLFIIRKYSLYIYCNSFYMGQMSYFLTKYKLSKLTQKMETM